MPKRLLPTPKIDQMVVLRAIVLLRRVFRLQPNTQGSRRPRENCFHLRARTILLYCYAFRPQTLVRPRQRSQRNVRSIETLWYKAQPNKMCIRSILWAILRLYRQQKEY